MPRLTRLLIDGDVPDAAPVIPVGRIITGIDRRRHICGDRPRM